MKFNERKRSICLTILMTAFIPFYSMSQNLTVKLKSPRTISDSQLNLLQGNDRKIDSFLNISKHPDHNLLASNDNKSIRDSVKYYRRLNRKIEENSKSLDDIVSFYGSAVVGAGTDFLSSVTSTGQINAQVNPFNRFFVALGANLLFANPGNKVKKDSVDLVSLMFPETGNFGVLASLYYEIPLNHTARETQVRKHNLVPQFSFAFRRVTIDSSTTGFKVLNYNVGLKYQLEFQDNESNRILFSLMPYFHFFNIPDEDVSNFNQLIDDKLFIETNKNAEIKSWGIKTMLQYNQLQFFFDIRRNMNTENLADGDPFKGTLVNVGFATWFRINLHKDKK